MQRQAVHRLERQEQLDHPIRVRLGAPALAGCFRRWTKHDLVHPDGDIAPPDQARVVLGPVLDPIDAFGLAGHERVFSYVGAKSQRLPVRQHAHWGAKGGFMQQHQFVKPNFKKSKPVLPYKL